MTTRSEPLVKRRLPSAVAALTLAGAGLFGLSSQIAAQSPPPAAEAATVMILVDGSGSMWGKPEGERQAKAYMVRDALKAGFSKIPKETNIGLAAFGHRRTSDCSDVETIVKPEPLNTDKLYPPLDKFNPRGRGPITNALRDVAKDLGPQSAPSSVILIHDDNDNCQLDPCSAVGELRRAHPKVTVHVISLAMKKEDAQRIACLPKATNGRHFEVSTQAQVTQAVEDALRLASLAGQPATPTPATAISPPPAVPLAPPDRPGVQLSASLAPGSDAIELPVRWRISKANDTSGVAVWEGDAAAPLIELPSGRYDVEAWLGFVRARSTVDAVAGQRRTLALSLGAGTVKFGQLTPKARSIMRDALISFRRIDGGPNEAVAIQRGLEPEIALVAGSYIVSVTVGALRIDRGVTIRPGDRLPFQPPLSFGDIELSAVPATGAPALDEAEFSLFEDDPDAPQGRREIARSVAVQPRFTLPPGTYYAVARVGAAETRERITVRAGESEARALVVEAARLTVAARLPGGRIEITEPVTHRLERLGGDARDVQHANRATSVMRVAAGRYKLETRIGTGNVRSEREIELKPGARDQVVVELPAGLLVLRLLDGSGGAALPDVAWDIRDAQGQTVWLANLTEARPLLLAGRYTVTATTRGRKGERIIDVRASEVRAFDLTSQ
ncbi:MAG: vWA domain-containing protein [Hyphomicrobiaceae bacterium]